METYYISGRQKAFEYFKNLPEDYNLEETKVIIDKCKRNYWYMEAFYGRLVLCERGDNDIYDKSESKKDHFNLIASQCCFFPRFFLSSPEVSREIINIDISFGDPVRDNYVALYKALYDGKPITDEIISSALKIIDNTPNNDASISNRTGFAYYLLYRSECDAAKKLFKELSSGAASAASFGLACIEQKKTLEDTFYKLFYISNQGDVISEELYYECLREYVEGANREKAIELFEDLEKALPGERAVKRCLVMLYESLGDGDQKERTEKLIEECLVGYSTRDALNYIQLFCRAPAEVKKTINKKINDKAAKDARVKWNVEQIMDAYCKIWDGGGEMPAFVFDVFYALHLSENPNTLHTGESGGIYFFENEGVRKLQAILYPRNRTLDVLGKALRLIKKNEYYDSNFEKKLKEYLPYLHALVPARGENTDMFETALSKLSYETSSKECNDFFAASIEEKGYEDKDSQILAGIYLSAYTMGDLEKILGSSDKLMQLILPYGLIFCTLSDKSLKSITEYILKRKRVSIAEQLCGKLICYSLLSGGEWDVSDTDYKLLNDAANSLRKERAFSRYKSKFIRFLDSLEDRDNDRLLRIYNVKELLSASKKESISAEESSGMINKAFELADNAGKDRFDLFSFVYRDLRNDALTGEYPKHRELINYPDALLKLCELLTEEREWSTPKWRFQSTDGTFAPMPSYSTEKKMSYAGLKKCLVEKDFERLKGLLKTQIPNMSRLLEEKEGLNALRNYYTNMPENRDYEMERIWLHVFFKEMEAARSDVLQFLKKRARTYTSRENIVNDFMFWKFLNEVFEQDKELKDYYKNIIQKLTNLSEGACLNRKAEFDVDEMTDSVIGANTLPIPERGLVREIFSKWRSLLCSDIGITTLDNKLIEFKDNSTGGAGGYVFHFSVCNNTQKCIENIKFAFSGRLTHVHPLFENLILRAEETKCIQAICSKESVPELIQITASWSNLQSFTVSFKPEICTESSFGNSKFIIGVPAEGDDFINRESVIIDLQHSFEIENCVLLHGLMRSGKTSIAWNFAGSGKYMWIELPEIDSDTTRENFVKGIIYSIISKFNSISPARAEDLIKQYDLKQYDLDIDIIDFINKSSELCGKEILFTYDEAQDLSDVSTTSTEALSMLKKLIDKNVGKFLFIGSYNLISDLYDSGNSALIELSSKRKRKLSFLKKDEVNALLEHYAQAKIDGEYLYRMTNGLAYYVQLMGITLEDYLIEQGRSTTYNADLDIVANKIVHEKPTPIDFSLVQIYDTYTGPEAGNHQRLMRRLAEAADKNQSITQKSIILMFPELTQDFIAQTLEPWIDAGLLKESMHDGEVLYEFTMELCRLWLKNKKEGITNGI